MSYRVETRAAREQLGNEVKWFGLGPNLKESYKMNSFDRSSRSGPRRNHENLGQDGPVPHHPKIKQFNNPIQLP